MLVSHVSRMPHKRLARQVLLATAMGKVTQTLSKDQVECKTILMLSFNNCMLPKTISHCC